MASEPYHCATNDFLYYLILRGTARRPYHLLFIELMKQKFLSVTVALAAFALMGAGVSKNAIKYSKGTAIVNTSSIVKARGFQGKTPVKIYIKGNRITKIVSLPNQETPAVFARAEELLSKFVGKKVDDAATMKVDGVSGATYSSKALIENVRGGLKYYKENAK